MSNKNKNNNVKEEATNVTNEVTNQETQNDNVQNPPAAVEATTEEKKSWFQQKKEQIADAFDKDKHPTRHKIAVGVGKGLKVAAYTGAVVGVTVGALAFAGSKKKSEDEDQYDEDDQYDDYDDAEDQEDKDNVVADTDARDRRIIIFGNLI